MRYWINHYECSCDKGTSLRLDFVDRLCNCNPVTGGEKNFWSQTKEETEALKYKYKTCDKFRFYGIKN